MYATTSFLLLTVISSAAAAGVKFSFDLDAEDGPLNWADLNIDNNQCGGMAQSGIDIPTGPCDEQEADYMFDPGTCTPDDLVYSINDHVVQLTFDTTVSDCTPPSMVIPGVDTTWDVLQYHIHAGSDHTLDDRHYGADMHIVHINRNDNNSLAVLGMFLEPTSTVATSHFKVLLDGLVGVDEETQAKCNGNVTTDNNVTATERSSSRRSRELQDEVYNPYAKIPANSTMYFYSGGLTTPPCLEIVTWNVIDTPVSLSILEYNQIIDVIISYTDPDSCEQNSVFAPSGFTSRPVQPLNGRTITHKCPTGTEGRFEVMATPPSAPTPTTPTAPTPTTSNAAAITLTTIAFVMTFITVGML